MLFCSHLYSYFSFPVSGSISPSIHLFHFFVLCMFFPFICVEKVKPTSALYVISYLLFPMVEFPYFSLLLIKIMGRKKKSTTLNHHQIYKNIIMKTEMHGT